MLGSSISFPINPPGSPYCLANFSQGVVTFPTIYVSVSCCLAIISIILICRRSKRRIKSEPHCHQCNYNLTGLHSFVCPECGTPIDPSKQYCGYRLSRRLRVGTGLFLFATAVASSFKPIERWAGSLYLYPYRPTFLVMKDLRDGEGVSPPDNIPLTYELGMTHGWISEGVDLSRIALDELLERENPENYRRPIGEKSISLRSLI